MQRSKGQMSHLGNNLLVLMFSINIHAYLAQLQSASSWHEVHRPFTSSIVTV
jgi:hypothetical protein